MFIFYLKSAKFMLLQQRKSLADFLINNYYIHIFQLIKFYNLLVFIFFFIFAPLNKGL
jgi:hypothetical protein